MAFRAPTAFLQNENLHSHRGKSVHRLKADLPKVAKTGLQKRKALRDLSNTRKPPVSGAIKGSALKEKDRLDVPDILTDEKIKICEEWAKEGIEYCHFTGTDMQNLHEEEMEKRINKEVNEEKAAKDFEDIKMELEPEVFLNRPTDSRDLMTEQKQLDDLIDEYKEFYLMHSLFSPFLEHPVNFELKDYLTADDVADLNNL